MSWPEVELNEVATLDRTTVKPEDIISGTNYIGLEHIESGGKLLGHQEVEAGELSSGKFKFSPEHILYGKLRPYLGKITTADFNGICSTDIIPVLPTNKIDRQYLLHFLKQPHMIEFANSRSSGANLPRLSPKELAVFKIPLPPLEEQKRIAAILDQADTIVKKRQASLDKLNTLGQSIFYDMFGDPLINLKSLPVVSLDSAGELNRGVSKHRPRNHPALLGGPHPLIQTGDVANSGDYITDYHSTYSDMGLAQSKKWPEKTLCITIAANIANTSILNFEACFPDSVVGFIPNPDFEAIFVHYWFKCVREDIERLAPAVAQKNINLKILRELEIFKPPFIEQRRFASRMTDLENSKQQNVKSLEASFKMFSSLQNDAFSGGL